MNDNKSLAHTTWNCKYHIVFAPKYRRKVFYGEHKEEIGKILRELCNWKQVSIIEAEVCPDHIHMLVEIPPKMSVSGFIGFLKGKSTLIIFERHLVVYHIFLELILYILRYSFSILSCCIHIVSSTPKMSRTIFIF